MRVIPLSQLRDGMLLAADLRTGRPHEVPLLRAGACLTSDYVPRLTAMGVHALWIDDALAEGVEPLPAFDPEARAHAESRVSRAFAEVSQNLERGGGVIPPGAVATLADVAAGIAQGIADVPEGALALQDLAAADAYTHRHSVQVAVLGLLIARRHWRRHGYVDWRGDRRQDGLDRRLALLGLGLLLHDIGKLATPASILDKPEALTEEEMEVMRRHPSDGVGLLRSADPSPLVLAVVRDHHERLDGSGYPAGKNDVHEFAQICAIADVFDAITSERVYKAASPAHVGVELIGRDGAAGRLDPDLVATFRAVCVPFPLGAWLELDDGRRGAVVAIDTADPWFVTIRHHAADGTAEDRLDLRHMDRSRSGFDTAGPRAITSPGVQHRTHRWDAAAASV